MWSSQQQQKNLDPRTFFGPTTISNVGPQKERRKENKMDPPERFFLEPPKQILEPPKKRKKKKINPTQKHVFHLEKIRKKI